MFRREPYERMRPILEAFVVAHLRDTGFALGGATRIALAFGEVRISRDLDFLASDPRGFADLRQRVRSEGYAALFVPERGFLLPREPLTDQYGIRFPAVVAGVTVKVELIREARITLAPSVLERDVPVPCLSLTDAYAEKLLALSDRGADPSQLDRDLVDLAVLRIKAGPVPAAALSLAESAYGDAIHGDLRREIERFSGDEARRTRSMRALMVDDVPLVLAGVAALATDFGA